ncbi:MAG: SDR family NAD(P)-dependent oxidoreductase [Nitrospira sp.]
MILLENRVVVVTGASQGIGRAIALGLAKKKAVLFLVARNGLALQEVADIARTSSPRVMLQAVDLAVDGADTEIAESLGQEFGGLDGLVHCAGAFSKGALETASMCPRVRNLGY